MEIITNWRSGIAVYGSLIGALSAALIYCKVKKINFWILIDFAIVYFPLGQAVGRWGNFVNQEAFGGEVSWLQMPWRMTGNIIQQQGYMFVHPTFLYESIWCILILVFLLWFRDKAKLRGEVVSLYFILYGIERAFVEGLRTDSLMFYNFRVSQVLSIVLVVVLSAVFIYRRYKLKNSSKPKIIEGTTD
jgi:prolipoprotein diacylglyceryl transferase